MTLQNSTKRELDWYLIDAEGLPVGRVATQIADLLRGKKKVDFMPNTDGGDHVVVVNADKVILTGHKEDQKRYYTHSGYLGNLKTKTVKDMRKDYPTEILKHAVYGMISNNKLKDGFTARLHMFVGPEHTHKNIKFKEILTAPVKNVTTK